MHKVAQLQSGWCNPCESYASYSWRLEESARLFVTSLVYAVLNRRVLDMASAGASGTVTVEDQRLYTKIGTLCDKNPKEIHSALYEVCGEQTVDCSAVCDEQTVDCSAVSRWATCFREGRVTINDDQRPGRLKTTDERSVKLVADFLAQDHRTTCKETSQATKISPTSAFRILTNDLQKRKICARWLPHCLTAERKQKRLEIATLLKQRFNVEGQAFLCQIVATDETWVRDFEPELKSQSNEWRSPTSPWHKKFRWAQSKVKRMIIFAYDHRGIIMTEFHVEQVWQQCTIMTGCKNCAEKCTKIDLSCSGMGHSFCTTVHARTWRRLWPIC